MQETKKIFWPLMKNCITADDKTAMIEFIQKSDRFTNGPQVKEFEKQWSKWLGVDFSLFVSSGSTANFLLVSAIIEKYQLQKGDKVIVPAMTWVTNIGPIIQLGLQPIFCDVDPRTFSFDLKHLQLLATQHDDIKLVFVSHLFGVFADIHSYKKILPSSIFIEDVCESHGANFQGKKAGTFSSGSTFSFYYGHHMTTVEGGFVCTSDADLYEIMKCKRSHGLAREASPEAFNKYQLENPDVHPQFLFGTDGYNFRNTEINAVLGLSQLKRLDENNRLRGLNLKRFLKIIEKIDFLDAEFRTEGSCSFCLIFLCSSYEQKIDLETCLSTSGIETRPLCSGNLLKQPFLSDYRLEVDGRPNVEELHECGFFIGNNHLISDGDFLKLEKLLNEFAEKQKNNEKK